MIGLRHTGILAALALTSPALAGPIGFQIDMTSGTPRLVTSGPNPLSGEPRPPIARVFGDTYDNEIQLMDQDLLTGQYLWSGLGGQSVPYSGSATVVGQAFHNGADVSASATESPLAGGIYHIVLTCTIASGEFIPTGLTLPGGTPMNSLYWQVGAAGIGDRDGNPDSFDPFPAAPSWDLLDGSVSGYAGATQLFSFPGTGVPAFGLTDVDLYMTLAGGAGIGLTSINIDMLARPTPAPGTLALAAAGLLAARRRRQVA